MKSFHSGVPGAIGALTTGALGLLESAPQQLVTPNLRFNLPAANLTSSPALVTPEAPQVSTSGLLLLSTPARQSARVSQGAVNSSDDLHTHWQKTQGSSLEQIMVENCLISNAVPISAVAKAMPFILPTPLCRLQQTQPFH